MTMDPRLLSLLVCPLCKGPLSLRRSADGRASDLACVADRLAFAVRDGIAVMLESEARTITDEEAEALREQRSRGEAR